MPWFEDPADVFRLATFVMSDYTTEFDIVPTYLVGNTPANERSILLGGLDAYEKGIAGPIVLCGGGPYYPPGSPPGTPNAYSGGDAWKEWLIGQGVQEEEVIFMDSPRPPLSHTGTDAERFVRFAKERSWKMVMIVACPAHMLRAFVITVSQALLEYPELLIYCKPGAPQAWDIPTAQSQGKVCNDRLSAGMDLEWDRLNKVYGNRYDLASAKDVIEYIKRRDAAARTMLST